VDSLIIANLEGLDQHGERVNSWPQIYISLIALQASFSAIRASGPEKFLLNATQIRPTTKIETLM